jgi:stage II sporulation protein AA (anti-sigma F factor antagonist)
MERDARTEACIVHLSGEIDIATVPDIQAALEKAIDTGCRQAVLDLARVTYIDSSALGLLVWLDHELAPNEGKVVIAGANTDVSRILELSGLVGVAPTISARESVDSALAGLEPSEAGELRWTETILLPARADSLAGVRSQVAEVLEPVELTEAARFDIKVAVGEAVANAVRHGSPGGERDEVRIDVSAFDDRVVIEVRDRGHGFDDGDTPSGDDLFASSGRGLVFMRALMDDVDFESDADGGGAVVRLVKRLSLRRNGLAEDDAAESA